MRRDASRSATTTLKSARAGGSLARFALAALAVGCAALMITGSAAAAPPTEIDTIDGTGTAAGAFGGFLKVAVDETSGDVYVLDQEHDSVARFSSTGTFISELKGSETAATTFGFGAWTYNAITVDNSSGPGQGDVYVSTIPTIFKLEFDPTPSEVWEVPGTAELTCGVAVDAAGDPWVGSVNGSNTTLDQLNAGDGSFTGSTLALQEGRHCSYAFDDDAVLVPEVNSGFERYDLDGGSIMIQPPPFPTYDAAASFKRNDFFSVSAAVGAIPTIQQWDRDGGLISSIAGVFGGNQYIGVALDGVRNRLYVADAPAALIRVYDVPPQPPTIVAKAVTDIGQASATLHAAVNPNGSDVTECHAEYLTEAEYLANGETFTGALTASCAPAAPISGLDDVEVSAEVAGLVPGTAYRTRFVATNGGDTTDGDDVLFNAEAIEPPTVTTGSASAITQTGATLSGTVNPNGFATSCKFQYGTSTSYGSEVAATGPGAGSGPVDVKASVGGLNANTDYHFRLVCTNGGGTAPGIDRGFKTDTALIVNPPKPPDPPVEPDPRYAACVKQANTAAKKAKMAAKKKKGKAKAKAIKAANKKRTKAIKACRARYL